jgi:transcription elongation factor
LVERKFGGSYGGRPAFQRDTSTFSSQASSAPAGGRTPFFGNGGRTPAMYSGGRTPAPYNSGRTPMAGASGASGAAWDPSSGGSTPLNDSGATSSASECHFESIVFLP